MTAKLHNGQNIRYHGFNSILTSVLEIDQTFTQIIFYSKTEYSVVSLKLKTAFRDSLLRESLIMTNPLLHSGTDCLQQFSVRTVRHTSAKLRPLTTGASLHRNPLQGRVHTIWTYIPATWHCLYPTVWRNGNFTKFRISGNLVISGSSHRRKVSLSGITGWPRHRENREFGSYFFQTEKTQGILLWHREKFWDTGKIFFCDTGKNLDTGKIFDCDY